MLQNVFTEHCLKTSSNVLVDNDRILIKAPQDHMRVFLALEIQ